MINRAVIMGRLTADPELRHTPSDLAVTSFTVAVDRRYARQGGERETDFLDVVAWRQQAEFITRYFRKGDMIALEGTIQARSYDDRNGVRRKAVEIVVDNVSFCGSKRDSGSQYGGAPMRDEPSAAPAASYSSADLGDFEEITDDDDDLPF